MGPFRRMSVVSRGRLNRLFAIVTLSLACPSVAFAEVCDKERPLWDGTPVNAVQEALFLTASLPSLVLILVTALALRFRNRWAGLAAVCGWSAMVYLLTFGGDPTGIGQLAAKEGCVGSPTLFIAVVFTICVGTILYTAPAERRNKV